MTGSTEGHSESMGQSVFAKEGRPWLIREGQRSERMGQVRDSFPAESDNGKLETGDEERADDQSKSLTTVPS